ncbi:MAG: FecR domain-containing protein [Flavobacteriales bacterium]|nr:FecR domain-containing protein [Flavobacteriales bacterium]
MKNNDITYKEKIEKYLVEEASVEEILEIKALIDSDEEVKGYYLQMKAIVELTEAKEGQERINIDQKFEEFLKQRKTSDIEKVVPIIPMWTNIVKVAAVLLVAAGLWYVTGLKQEIPSVIAQATDAQVEQQLADGTSISLNKNSTLSYPESFDDNVRLVKLKGEGYFEVESDPNKPFIIEVGNTRVQVMGTKFNVNGYNTDSIVVTVTEGSVLVYLMDDNVADFATKNYITEGCKGSVMKGDLASSKALNDNLNFLFWYDGNLHFQEEALGTVVDRLNKEWNSNLIVSDEMLQCPFSTTFTSNDIDYIVELISLTFNAKVESTEAGQVISGEGCQK